MNSKPDFKNGFEKTKAEIPIGARFVHYKNPAHTYRVIALAVIEATLEPAVVYQAEYDPEINWIRPATVFLEMVEWNGEMVPRFKRIS